MKLESVTYTEPTIRRTLLGKKPANEFTDSPQVSQDYVTLGQAQLNGPTQSVWGDVPDKNSDGSPALHTVQVDVDVTPRSPLKYGAIAAGIGAVVGALAGLAGAPSLGVSSGLGALGGALSVATVAGGGAALAVHGDRVKVVWTTHQILDHQMLGYNEYVGPGEKDGKRGYFHRYIPDLQETVLGSYQLPQAVHYKEEAQS